MGEFIYWVETHTGIDEQIKVVLKKLEWLKNWLRGDGRLLVSFERDIVWVSSGHTLFTKGLGSGASEWGGIGGFDDQMKVVGHQAKTVNLLGGFMAGLIQRRQEKPAIVVVAENGFFVVAPIHGVVNCARILNSAPFEPYAAQISNAKPSCQL